MKGKTLLGRYEIIDIIGQGGMAFVYKAKDNLLNRLVAIKVLKSEFNDNEQFIKKFKRESQAAASLSHNNIVSVYDVGVEENHHFIVMEYIAGDTLKEYIQQKGHLTWKETAYIAKQIALALDHAHKNNVIHRDIKPHNILMAEDLVPKVADFGIARAITTSTITLVEETMGSVHYLSPEQARGGFVDERSDLYSLGIVMYEMMTGRVPFDGDSSISVAIKHIQEEIEFLEEDLDHIPEAMEDIVLKLIQKNPEDRYANARELIQDISAAQSGEKVKNQSQNKKGGILPGILPVAKPKAETQQVKRKKEKPIYKKPIFWGAIVLGVALLVVLGTVLANMNRVKDVEVPGVDGLERGEAIAKIEAAGLTYEIDPPENNATIAEDHVIRQTPQSGTTIKEGQVVHLVLSAGPRELEVPNVIGKFEVEGIQELENANFVIKEINRQFNDEHEKDVIYDQNPRPGLLLKEGTEIILYVSKGKDTVIMENYVGQSLETVRNAIAAAGLQVGEIREEASSEFDRGIVLNQEPKANMEVAKNTVVSLTVSQGILKTKTIQIKLKDYVEYDKDEEVPTVPVKVIFIDQTTGSNVVYDRMHKADETVNVELQGLGVQYYQLEIDGQTYNAEIITF
ncbi:Stk1 family PASTA domain-containing Ser/Thr kinase [Alkalibacter rhizosphaerae]|uniref:non-specific serine/threonine protein kinase n=1 Tax=Alkalibacter rhizosphaerae TaxID=2815577 RepID=A0A974XF67_9FIRM|nr:Stk1 family PASTA domain-containing Ser/Thr kinase [Alkalibacter rhizosphaerae]QSX08742.1 Stk1 family PASTA domain-containing Ser/Thr kinase [Alkalibacter rhizosphaerae]